MEDTAALRVAASAGPGTRGPGRPRTDRGRTSRVTVTAGLTRAEAARLDAARSPRQLSRSAAVVEAVGAWLDAAEREP